MELLKQLTETPGVPGREERIRAVVVSHLKPHVDSLRIDALGNVIGMKKGKGKGQPRVMVAAHMDQIGFLVSHIDDRGFLRLAPLGGFDPRVLNARHCWVHGREDLRGVLALAGKPTHLQDEEDRKKPPRLRDYYVDLGVPVDTVKDLVEIGDPVTLAQEMVTFGEVVAGQALDDRVGVYVLLEAVRRLKKHRAEVYWVISVQEEVGLRGAATSAFGIEPDIGIAIDITIAADTPMSDGSPRVSEVGKGVAIKVMDSASISDRRLVDACRDLAKQHHIPYQLEILPRGGTDAGAMQRSRAGVPAITLSIPTRYAHTVIELAHREDIEATIILLMRTLEAAGPNWLKPLDA